LKPQSFSLFLGLAYGMAAGFPLLRPPISGHNRRPMEPHLDGVEVAGNQKVGSRAVEQRKTHARARISNGKDILPNVDGRSLIARRYRDICHAILVDQGGADRCSESRQQLIRRFAAAAVLAEQMEAALARGETIDIQDHALLCSTLTRLASRIGIDRQMRTVNEQSLDDLIAEDDAAHAAD
jgi:hypothetical protein